MINKVLQIKTLINKQICKENILKLRKNFISTNRLNRTTNLLKYSFDDNYLPSIEEKVNFLDQHIMNLLNEKKKNLLEDETVRQIILQINKSDISKEGIDNPVTVNRLIKFFAMLKVIPNHQMLKSLLKYIEIQNPFMYYTKFKQEEMLKFLENLVLIKKALTKKNSLYFKISNILYLYLGSFRSKLKNLNNYKLFSFLINFDKSETKYYNLCNKLIVSITSNIKDLSLKECLSIIWVASNQNIYATKELIDITDKIMKFDLENEIKNDEKFLLLLNYLTGYSINYLEQFGNNNFPGFLLKTNLRLFNSMIQNDKITLIELIDFHYYFYLMNDFDSLRITSEKIVEESNLIRLSSYHLIINSFKILSKDNLDLYDDLTDLMSQIVNKLNNDDILGESAHSRAKILFSVFNTTSLLKQKINQTTYFNLLKYYDLFNEIAIHFRLTVQISPLLNHLKSIDENKLTNYFTQFIHDNIKTNVSNIRLMNFLLMILTSNLVIDQKQLQEFVSNQMELQKSSAHEMPFLSLEQKLLYNSVLSIVNEKYGTKYEFHELGESEIKIKNVFLSDQLKFYIKKVRYALYLIQGHIIDNIFFLDCYVPTKKLGFLIVSEKNIFENRNYREEIHQSYLIYKEILKSRYDIELVILEESLVLYHPEILKDLINKCLVN